MRTHRLATLVTAAFFADPTDAFGPKPGCRFEAQFPCLPGVDAVGIGYDAVRGTSFGVGLEVVQFNYTKSENYWDDPFGNNTKYNFPDQARVMQKTTQSTSHSVHRSVQDYITEQQNDARVSAGFGMFFKASTETKWASQTMSDNLHIVADSKCELGIYSITLDPPMFLQPHPKFLRYIDYLPEAFDSAAYQRFIDYYGTHYIYAATLGGRARMKTVVSHGYYSTQSDSSITANLHATWGGFGGGGGGGSSSHTKDEKWDDNSQASTYTEGGDPAIKSFNSADEWAAWAKSVETGSPVVTSVALEPIWSMIPDGQKKNNVIQAVQAYASNETFPVADPTSFQMGWCDCERMDTDASAAGASPFSGYAWHGCGADGFFSIARASTTGRSDDHMMGYTWCCRPCFTAQN